MVDTKMTGKSQAVGLNLWLWWVTASIIGYTAGDTLAHEVRATSAHFVSDPLFGAVVGVMQLGVLRRRTSWAGWWVMACIIGFTLGDALGDVVDDAVSAAMITAAGDAAYGTAFGGMVGLAKWLVLRRRGTWNGWWVVASIIGFTFAYGGGRTMALAVYGDFRGTFVGPLIGLVQGVVVGSLTGIVMVRLLRDPDAQAKTGA